MAVCIYLLAVALNSLVAAQQEKILSYSIYEETPSNTFIADIRRDAKLQEELGDVFTDLRYAILPQSSEYSSYFTIDELDGVLRTAAKINRDDICKQKVSCPVRLDLTIQPREYFQIIKVTVVIDDTNDNPPNFVPGHFSRSVAENTQPGASFTIPTAEDPDSPKFGIKRYELVTGAPHFMLKVTNNSADGSFDLHLVLQETLDREMRELYRVVVAAYDGGAPPNSGFLTIDVIVTDINDNNPKFDNQTYTVTVPENVDKDVVIIRVQAKDADSGPNGQVIYGFTGKTFTAFGHLFSLNNATGEITVKDALNYEENTVYNLAVTARDLNPESLAALAKVIVHVQDINDHAPEITINALTSTGHVEISEGAPINSFVAHISVTDPDSGQNGQFTCSLDSSYFNIQQMYQTEYKVVTTKEMDRETTDNYDLTFVCEDQGTHALTSTTQISVTILDENDSAPQFSKQTYSSIMAENNPTGSFVVQVTATDADEGQNGMVEYRPFGKAVSVLNVNPLSGNVTARVAFDYEEAETMEFLIIATDHGQPANTATATLIVKLTDVDDELPMFSEPEYIFDVYENLPLGTEVGQVSATDRDSPPFNEFLFAIDPDTQATDAFVVDPQSGKIFTRRELDREERSTYELTLTAFSRGAPAVRSKVRAVIHVADRNDNVPQVLYPNPRNNTVHVSNRVPVGDKVVEIKAVDGDIGINSQLTYTLVAGNEEDFFTINEHSGHILVKSSLQLHGDEVFKLSIKIDDSGEPRHTVDAVLNIVVNKSADLPIMSNQNLNIVVSVAVLSAILTIILTVAIVITKRLDKSRTRKSQSLYNTSPEQASEAESGKQSTIAATTKTEQSLAYQNKVDLHDERLPKYNLPGKQKEKQITKQPKTNNHSYGQHSHQMGSVAGNKMACYPSVHQLALSHPRPGPQPHTTARSSCDDSPREDLPKLIVKEGDSDSTNSAPVSITDSGRGSNEDTNESRPSVDSTDHPHHATEGLDLRTPVSPSRHGNSDSFKARLSDVVLMQGEHAQERLRRKARDPNGREAVDSRQQQHSVKPGLPDRGNRRTTSGRGGQVHDCPSGAVGRHQYQHSGSHTLSHPAGIDCTPSSAQTAYLHSSHGNQPSHYGNCSQDNAVPDSSWIEDDESESDWSDEDKEYVYYVNASHV